MIVYKIELDGIFFITKEMIDINAIIENAEIEDIYTVSKIEMTEEEFQLLPEFEGF